MRSTHFDVGDHINPGRIAWWSSYLSHEGFSCQSSLRANLCEIFAVAVFSTFSTASAMNGLSKSTGIVGRLTILVGLIGYLA
jgi:hypothetical protein